MKRIRIVLFFLFLIAVFLRVYNISDNLFFGPEQGIDFLVIRDIVVNHKLTLIGAKTDISGIFHGPIYYYLSTIPFAVSRGNPLVVLSFFVILNCTTVFLIYFLGKYLFNKRTGLIASIVFTVSFESIVYSRWLSSHPISIPLSCLYFVFLYKFLNGSKISLIAAAFSYALLGQSEFLNFLFYGIITLLVFVYFRKKLKKKLTIRFVILSSLVFLVLSVANYILFDLRHYFLITKSVLKLLSGGSGYHLSLERSISENLTGFFSAFSQFTFPFNIWIGLLACLIGLVFLIKSIRGGNSYSILVLFWLFTPLILLILLRHDVLKQFFVSIGPASILVIAFTIDILLKKVRVVGLLMLTVVFLINFHAWFTNIPDNKNIFFQSTQPDLKYSDQLRVIDEIYDRSENKPFSFQSYTIPYWLQQVWEYLFWYYGRQKYGYEPIKEKAKMLFVIIQDDPSNKIYQKWWMKDTISKWGMEVDNFSYGILLVKQLVL